MSLFGLEREMGYTHAEFFGQAPRTFKNIPYQIVDNCIICTLKTGTVNIRVGTQKIRHITASMRLPYLDVSISFDGVTAEEQKSFLRLFDTSFQKGGG